MCVRASVCVRACVSVCKHSCVRLDVSIAFKLVLQRYEYVGGWVTSGCVRTFQAFVCVDVDKNPSSRQGTTVKTSRTVLFLFVYLTQACDSSSRPSYKPM